MLKITTNIHSTLLDTMNYMQILLKNRITQPFLRKRKWGLWVRINKTEKSFRAIGCTFLFKCQVVLDIVSNKINDHRCPKPCTKPCTRTQHVQMICNPLFRHMHILKKNSVGFLGDMKTPKGHFEIN